MLYMLYMIYVLAYVWHCMIILSRKMPKRWKGSVYHYVTEVFLFYIFGMPIKPYRCTVSMIQLVNIYWCLGLKLGIPWVLLKMVYPTVAPSYGSTVALHFLPAWTGFSTAGCSECSADLPTWADSSGGSARPPGDAGVHHGSSSTAIGNDHWFWLQTRWKPLVLWWYASKTKSPKGRHSLILWI